jgi:hypothetical protein
VASARDAVVARGTSEDELRHVAELLHDAGIPFDVDEGVGADSDHPQWTWQVRVPVESVDGARRAMAGEHQLPATSEPSPRPLFDSRGPNFIRVVLSLAAFGLAGGLWLQTCGVT